MKIQFLSKNEYKIAEVTRILNIEKVQIAACEHDILEIQSQSIEALVKDKCLKAYNAIRQPIFVEHTALEIAYLNNFPGGLTQVFWDKLGPDKLAELFRNVSDKSVTAKTTIGFCDGKKLHQFQGQIEGTIPDSPRGNRDFQWDCVFIPVGHDQTFAEMGEKKDEISMRRIALNKFKAHLESIVE